MKHQRFRRLMQRHGLTQARTAELLHIGLRTATKYYSGRFDVPEVAIMALLYVIQRDGIEPVGDA